MSTALLADRPAPRPSTHAEHWRREYLTCAIRPGYFIDRYLIIDDAQDLGHSGGRIPFRLWKAQIVVLQTLQTERHIVILKPRQLGISWVVCAYVLWRAVFQPGQDIFLFSRGKAEAKELLRRIRALYDRLPEALRERLPALQAGNKETLEWVNGSRIQSMASTPGSGVSFTASVVVMDEAAHMTWGAELYGNVRATVAEGGQIIIFSTAKGVGNWFHTLWDQSKRGLNSFARVFLPWWSRPGRTREWYERERANATDQNVFLQNYPRSDVEAFRSSGRARFAAEWVEAQAGNLREPIPSSRWPYELRIWRGGWPGIEQADLPRLDMIRGLSIYAGPEQLGQYLIAADVAEGKEVAKGTDPDWDAAVILDTRTWTEVASFHGRPQPDEYARILMALSEVYRGSEIIVERNNHGHSVLATMRTLRFPRIAEGPDGAQGWLTHVQSKPLAIDGLAEALRDRVLAIRTNIALSEMQMYSVLKNGSTGGSPGFHDDFVMAWAIGLAYLRFRANRHVARTASIGPHPLAGYRG